MNNKAYRDTTSTCRDHYKKCCNNFRYRNLEKEGLKSNPGFEHKPYDFAPVNTKARVKAVVAQ